MSRSGRMKETGDSADVVDIVTKENLEYYLAGNTKWAGQNLFVCEETDSTNLQAKRLGETGAPNGTLVIADRQSAGRGRRGRGWDSPKRCNIYMSLLLRPDFVPDKASMLTLVMAYSVQKAIYSCTGLDTRIKWPNDIVFNGKKLVGILTEMSVGMNHICHVIIGVGINVNVEAFPGEIADKATSLQIEAGTKIERNRLAAEVMKQFEQDYESFVETGNLSWMKQAYNDRLVNHGREVVVHGEKEPYRALALGINDMGELCVRLNDGREEAVFAGEVSVRGVYGYV